MSDRLRRRPAAVAALLALLCLAGWRSFGRTFGLLSPTRPVPDVADVRYGPHERNLLDIWKAKPPPGQTGPTPVVIYFHGGGFRGGDKSSVPAWLVIKCLDAGISVASANYRLSQTATFPAPMLDGARAIQFVRYKAVELGIDPDRIAAAGNSAGAGIALWAGFHDDLANPESGDAVERASSRVCCLGVDGAQTSYDPRFIKSLIGGRAHEHPALRWFYGIKSEAEADSPRAQKMYEAASPINYVTSDDPPVIMFYAEPDAPLPADAKAGQGIHHPRFGRALKSKLDSLGVECIVEHWADFPKRDDPVEEMCREMTSFFLRRIQGMRPGGLFPK
jgi:acetyl esterase/lipase